MSLTTSCRLSGTYHSSLNLSWQARQAHPYHITDWNRTRVLSVSPVHGSHSSCPVIREVRVPARTLKQAISSTGTHHITALPQRFIDPRPSALVFTAALIHSLHRWNELLWFWRGSRRRRRRWRWVGDQVTSHSCVASVRQCRSHPPLTN